MWLSNCTLILLTECMLGIKTKSFTLKLTTVKREQLKHRAALHRSRSQSTLLLRLGQSGDEVLICTQARGNSSGPGLHLNVCLQVCLGRFEWDKEPGVLVGRFPLTCGGFIFPHIHIGLMLCLSHASENPGSKALSGPLLSSGNLRCHCRQKKL